MSSKLTQVGSLTILLEFDPYEVQGARLSIPLLGIDEHISQFTQYESIPPGVYSATITSYMTSGREIEQRVKLKVLPGQGNLHQFKLMSPPKEVLVRPVDSENRTILYSEVKIEDVDMNFRPVREDHGLICRVRPGEYHVQIILPNLRVLTLPLKIAEDTQVYTLTVTDRHEESRKEPRMEVRLPVDYRTHDGKWIPTKSVDLSTTGICLVKREWTLDDEKLQVRLHVPHVSVPLEFPARVRWVKDEGSDRSRIGLELDVSDESRNTLRTLLQKARKNKS